MSTHALRVARVIDETPDARSIALEVPPALADRFRYRAGQFLTFRIPLAGGAVQRCYSLSSAPGIDPQPQVTVKRVAGGKGSNWMNDSLRPGATVEVQTPAGRFVLEPGEAPLVFFAGGSGITPILSLIKTALTTGKRRVRLIYANRDARSVIFGRQLAELARRHADRFELRQHQDDRDGLMRAETIASAAAGFEQALAYLCGPAPFMALVEKTLLGRGFPPARLRIERFVFSPESATAAASAPAPKAASGAVPAAIVIHLEGKRHVVPYAAGQSILEAARAAGLAPNSACEEGYCGSCAAKKLKGEVHMAHNEAFSAEEVAKGWILTCQGRPTGRELEIAYEG
ncbi:MAG: ferredoxin--NADP reductase [Alphaproteobacteria bacterium]|nr:ferredoxin--NADP reductase [Alphaproteobacteria bacterium]